LDIISGYGLVFLALACVFGLFMAWGIGANDVANAMGTSVGSRALTLKQAILVAAVFEFLGAYLAGGEVTSTIRKGIIDPELLTDSPQLLVYGMLAALLAAATWLAIASKARLARIHNAFHCWRHRRIRRGRHLRRRGCVGQGRHDRYELGGVAPFGWLHRLRSVRIREAAHP
jgi:hypothetical protein